ncbi:uncharacterized protein ACR2FA_012840 [Aphomia sociella]
MSKTQSTSKSDNEVENKKADKSTQDTVYNVEKVADYWLRVYPAPQLLKEGVTCTIFRCLFCQLGLAAMLVFWTMLWVFVIQSFEEPYETEVSLEFEKQQNQLVINLATELRQITPLSSKWKEAIEMRIEDERRLTMEAIGRGAKLRPGQFWELSGTFLFTVYVMTALGFGAPIPQTLWGRTLALVYAILAVPTHFYLKRFSPKRKLSGLRLVSVLCAGRCVPLAAAVYYMCGAVGFGLLRGKTDLEVVLFPLEFTTSGGLEHVEGYVRIMYGFYVEGAMSLLAYALATLRRHSSDAAGSIAEQYRLFTYAKK